MVVDSTFATPLRQQPLTHGATVVIHSGTKFIGGHSDLMIGLCVTADDAVHERLVAARTFQGATPGALEAFLALRGLRTLPVRLAASERTAAELVARLRAHPGVAAVAYPGTGAMVSFVCGAGAPAADAVCDTVRVIVPATSLGGVETTIERRQKYAGDAHVPPGLLRMSVGLEDVDDLWADLDRALRPDGCVVRIGRSRYVSSGARNPKRSYNPWASRVCNIQRRWAPGPSSIIAFTSATPSPAPRTVGRMKTSAR